MKILVLILMGLLLSEQTAAQSIAPDGRFDTGIIGWHCGGANPSWRSDVGSGDSGPGSLQMSREHFISTGGQLAIGACEWIVVTPHKHYQFTGNYLLPTDSEFENILIDLYWFTEAEDFISKDTLTVPTASVSRDTWLAFSMLETAPPDATKLAVNMSFQFYQNGMDPVSAFLLWDDLYLSDDVIFIDGFE